MSRPSTLRPVRFVGNSGVLDSGRGARYAARSPERDCKRHSERTRERQQQSDLAIGIDLTGIEVLEHLAAAAFDDRAKAERVAPVVSTALVTRTLTRLFLEPRLRSLDPRFCEPPTDAARNAEDSLNQSGDFEFAMGVGGCSGIEMMTLAIGMPRSCVTRGDCLEQVFGFFGHSSKIRCPSRAAR